MFHLPILIIVNLTTPHNDLLNAKKLHGNVLHMGISSSSNNFWHWMHEVFARLIRVKKEFDLAEKEMGFKCKYTLFDMCKCPKNINPSRFEYFVAFNICKYYQIN